MKRSDDGNSDQPPAASIDWRGPHRVYCPNCKDWQQANSRRLPTILLDASRSVHFPTQPDIAWFRRMRRCRKCATEFLTAELSEDLVNELYRLRQKEAIAAAKTLQFSVLRARHSLLDTTGNDVPLHLAEELVAGSAWWLTHRHGACRAPRHADRLRESSCGWEVDFGANSFASARAIAMARDYANGLFVQANDGNLPKRHVIEERFTDIPMRCVRNVNGDFYDHYPQNGAGDMVFGATSIDVNDCRRILMKMTGIAELLDEMDKHGG